LKVEKRIEKGVWMGFQQGTHGPVANASEIACLVLF
jgi:hypothetical protein